MYQELLDQLKESRYIRRPMEADLKESAFERWRKKPVLKTRKLSLYDNFDKLIVRGPGTLHRDGAISVSGQGSVRLDMPTSTAIKPPNNRRYAEPGIRFPLDHENLYEYNRISLWVRVESPGFSNQFVLIALHNEGEHIVPVPGRFEGTHHNDVVPEEWTQVIWEMPDIYRDNVTGISIYTFLPGSPMNAADRMSLYVDDLRLETVNPEKTRGFDLPAGAIAYCHSGYLADARKHAITQNCSADTFALKNANSGETVFTGTVRQIENGFALMDFSDFTAPGFYVLSAGDVCTKPLPIGPDAYLSAAWKTLNFFFTERCGFEVPGVHIECHMDAFCRHPDGRTLPVCGGWHDAADVSQSIDKTSDVIVAMLDLAASVKKAHPDLSERVLEEARWGLNWAMRTRFGDGYRHISLIKGIWSNNYRGDKDDMTGDAQNFASHNYAAAYACAYAAPFYKWDKIFSGWCLKCAVEDFFFAEETIDSSADGSLMSERLALAASAAAMLYRVTGEDRFLQAAAMRAKQLSQCQQLERRLDFSIPLHGYFYEDRAKTRPIGFFHRSTEQFYMKCFTLLLDDAPEHSDSGLWRQCVNAYADYIRETADIMAPYGILPAAVYEIGNTDYSKIYHEGARVGLPTLEEFNAQVKNGVKLNDSHYLRRFPVAYQFRGFHATLLSKAKNVFTVARCLRDKALFDIAARQLEYVLGFNPFAYSTMYGEGYDYPPLYGGFAGQPVGAVPVGFETFENDDEPYMPMQNNCTYKEIWVCSTARAMWSIAEIYNGI
ncbi:MAG: glycoside hydrolase family 9 protein [Oscillospiraceae bacterium]|nr:glycoside hydrolase family 9 protein [Oscillospiraceae bacterium]